MRLINKDKLPIGRKKMKAILITDMPDMCYYCNFCEALQFDHYCVAEDKKIDVDVCKTKPEFCPLSAVPEELKYNRDPWTNNAEEEAYKEGWNDCLEEITGETE